MKIYITDRIESGIAVCEDGDGGKFQFSADTLPELKEGDVVVLEDGKLHIDKKLTEERRKKIISLQNDLWE